jgi:hypothetical protein
VVDAAAAERLVEFAGAVRGEDDDGGLGGADRAAFGDGDGEVGEELEEEGLELMVGTVDLVDEEDAVAGGFEREEDGAGDEVFVGVEVDVSLPRLPDREHLAGEVPFVHRRRGVDPLVALEPDELSPQDRCEGLRGFGLADPRRAFEEEGLAEGKREVGGRREAFVRDVLGIAQGPGQRLRPVDPQYGAADDHQRALRGFGPPWARRPRRTFSGVTGSSSIRSPTAS